jgi:integrase/recombinase XerD
MQVARVISPVSSHESWTVLGEDDAPVAPVERYLAYLSDIERSPNTVKAYAHDLKDWFTFLADRGLDWRAVRLDDVGEFVAWLRLPLQARNGQVAVLPSVAHRCTESTVNRKLSAVGAFYTHAGRDGVEVGELLTWWQVGGGRGGWRPFLHHISKSEPKPRRVVAVRAPKKLRRVLTPVEVQAVLDGCQRLRDRLLFALLYDTGFFSGGPALCGGVVL